MAYNYFPATYQPAYQNKIWVIGEAGAKSYLVAPNSTVDLWDSEAPVIYIKSADASGMPSMKVLDYTVRETNRNPSNFVSNVASDNTAVYATKGEIDGIMDEIHALRTKLDRVEKKIKENDDE